MVYIVFVVIPDTLTLEPVVPLKKVDGLQVKPDAAGILKEYILPEAGVVVLELLAVDELCVLLLKVMLRNVVALIVIPADALALVPIIP